MPNTTTKPVGRPRAVIKLPRKREFTVADVIDINAVSSLTIRNFLKELIHTGNLVTVGTTKNKAGQRGRPRFIYRQ